MNHTTCCSSRILGDVAVTQVLIRGVSREGGVRGKTDKGGEGTGEGDKGENKPKGEEGGCVLRVMGNC